MMDVFICHISDRAFNPTMMVLGFAVIIGLLPGINFEVFFSKHQIFVVLLWFVRH